MKFEISGRLPGLNEIIDAAKQGKGKYQPYAMMKEHYTTMIGWLAKKLPKYEKSSPHHHLVRTRQTTRSRQHHGRTKVYT